MSKVDARKILSLIDLTSLNATDNQSTIDQLCTKAILASVAAVCVYPQFVEQAKIRLQNSPINIATVCNFPSGAEGFDDILSELHIATQANEIDVVFPYRQFLSGDVNGVKHFLADIRRATKTKVLKVILETGVYPALTDVTSACNLALDAGANFIKTSTGKIETGATINAARAILNTVKQSSSPCGVKISGGVRTLIQAQEYCQLAIDVFGEDWLTSANFRIGASQLVDELLLSTV